MRIVVIGHGMVGPRVAADLAAADPQARLTVLGQEDHDPYNRVQLSSVVAGKADPAALALEQVGPEQARVLRGVRAVRIDRASHLVHDELGEAHPYDRLVLATGSAARIPDVPGLHAPGGVAEESTLVDGVSPLKDLDDAERILRRCEGGGEVVVLGAGVLGIEVATGLAGRGARVTLVHHRERLMERQLDRDASEIVHGALETLGITVVTSASATRVDAPEGRLETVHLSDGSARPADLLVLCTGTVPQTALAAAAGLECGAGILVGEDLSCPGDPDVFAIGDCAQPPEGASGLVAQGWEQARRLVESWRPRAQEASVPVPARGTGGDLVRVKAVGLALVTMGRIERPGPGLHAPGSVRLADPSGGRFTEVVVHEGRLVAATIVGDEDAAAELSAAFTLRTPVPRDPVHLLARPLAARAVAPADSVADMAEEDVLCQCNGVTKGSVCAAVAGGCGSTAEVSRATRAGTGCGTCRSQIQELLDASRDREPAPV
ncbi:FAD-dependent oxidoreductase [Brachybacterium paraconglomeratum]|uniref:FAD-dependent oxidoreductase n=1 Tax=Brachybacterium paraconglomeratum TaxID=173362 RepID=UPI0037CAF87B